MTRHKKHGIKLRSMYQWHRYIGVSIALFIIILSVTGIMLNHTEQLNLNEKYVESDFLLNHYGISVPKKIKSFPAAKHWVSQWDNQLYLNSKPIRITDENIVGAIFIQNMIIIAQSNTLYIFTPDGELVERVSGSDGIPSGIEAIGITDKNLISVRAATGNFTTNEDLLFWKKSPAAISIWSDSAKLPKALQQTILGLYRGKGLSLERIVLDLHSGRIFGGWGVYFMDLIAIFMIFLASSGTWLWVMRYVKRKQHEKHKH